MSYMPFSDLAALQQVPSFRPGRPQPMVTMQPMPGYREGSFPVAQPMTSPSMPTLPVVGWDPTQANGGLAGTRERF